MLFVDYSDERNGGGVGFLYDGGVRMKLGEGKREVWNVLEGGRVWKLLE